MKKLNLGKPSKHVRSAPLFFDDAGGEYVESEAKFRGLSIMRCGVEARGHDFWIDEVSCRQVFDDCVGMGADGVKAHVGHGTLSDDGINRHVGQFSNFRLDDDGTPRADLTLLGLDKKLESKVAYYATKGKRQAGLSIAAGRLDREAMRQFMSEHADDDGNFVTPDSRNVRNLPHWWIPKGSWRSIDIVGSPAANPDGMFGELEESLFESREVLLYVLGVSDSVPSELSALSIDPTRVRGFVQRILEDAALSVAPILVGKSQQEVGSMDKTEKGATANLDENKDGSLLLAEIESLKSLIAENSAKLGELQSENVKLAALAQSERNSRRLSEARVYASTKLGSIPGANVEQLSDVLLAAESMAEAPRLVLLSVLESCNALVETALSEKGRGGDVQMASGASSLETEVAVAIQKVRQTEGRAKLSDAECLEIVFSENAALYDRWRSANASVVSE